MGWLRGEFVGDGSIREVILNLVEKSRRKEVALQAQWNALLATALLGTEQRKCAVVSPEVAFLSSLQQADPEKDPETWVLLASAYAAMYRRAGQTPAAVQPSQKITPAPTETKRYCSAPVAARLATLLTEAKVMEPFLEEMLIAFADKELLVPPHLLPALLTWGKRSKVRRALLIPVVGARGGYWLTQQNPEWKNALQTDRTDPTEQAEMAQPVSGQQALYEVLNITDSLFSKTYSVFKGQGLSGQWQVDSTSDG